MPDFTYLEAFTNGLRPDAKTNRNTQWLTQCSGLVPTEWGLKQLPSFSYPISSPTLASLLAWPHPQLLRADKVQLLLGATAIYTVTDAWVASALTVYDAHTPAVSRAIRSGGGVWHLAAFQDMWFLTNGIAMIYLIPSTSGAVAAIIDANTTSISNGTFTGNATGWTLGSGWAYGTNNLAATAADATSAEQLAADQVAVPDKILSGIQYTVTFTVSGYSAGTVTPLLGTQAGTARSADGTYTENIIANGTTFALLGGTGAAAFTGVIDTVSVVRTSTFVAKALANHDNRLVLGGLSGAYFSHTNFTAKIYDAWRNTTPDEVVVTDTDAFDTGWILYSAQAGGDNDIPFATFLAALNLPSTTTFTKFEEIIIGAIESGEMGMLPLRRAGDIYALKQLGGDLVAYGKNSISVLRFGELPYRGGSKLGYREQVIAEWGVASRGAVAGSNDEHVFVSKQGDMWRLSDKGLERLGYDEFVGALTLASIVMAHDPFENYYWISDGTNGYCYTRTGLGKCSDIMPSSVLRADDTNGLVGTGIIASPVTGVTVETELLDGGVRTAWEVGYIDISTTDTDTTGWQEATRYRLNKGDALTTKSAETFDDRGRLRAKTPGIEFAFRLTATDRTKVDLERMDIVAGRGKLSLRDLLNV